MMMEIVHHPIATTQLVHQMVTVDQKMTSAKATNVMDLVSMIMLSRMLLYVRIPIALLNQ
jgi:hypothetical protein